MNLKYVKTTGIANKTESILSRIPPCPGRIFPESFISAVLLNNDSVRSPNTPAIEMINPIIIQSVLFNKKKGVPKMYAAISVIRVPPKNPSHDFLGETRSNNLCFPNDIPKINANTSFIHKRMKKPRII